MTQFWSPLKCIGTRLWRKKSKGFQPSAAQVLLPKSRQNHTGIGYRCRVTLSPRLSGLPADVHGNVALQSFVDGIWHQEIRRMLRLMNIEDLKSTSVYAFKFRAAEQNSCRECHILELSLHKILILISINSRKISKTMQRNSAVWKNIN